MKNITIFIILGLFLISMTTVQTLTSRSKSQVVFHSYDISTISKLITEYYKSGYRVSEVISQPVATGLNEELQGEILVIMEK